MASVLDLQRALNLSPELFPLQSGFFARRSIAERAPAEEASAQKVPSEPCQKGFRAAKRLHKQRRAT